MNRNRLTALLVMAAAGSVALAQPPKDSKPAVKPGTDTKAPAALPAGMSEADMQAFIAAMTPGPNHEFLTRSVGTWKGTCKMWPAPGEEAKSSPCTSVITSLLDGRFTKCESTGEMDGMPFHGIGTYGFDNVSQKFTSTWIDSMGTGMAIGTGVLSDDKKTMTWTCSYNCPIKKGPITMREVDHYTSKDSTTLEMFGPDPKTGKEFKMMELTLTRTPGTDAVKPAGTAK